MSKINLKNKKLIIFISLFLVSVALFLRLYKINSNFLFAFDQGDDALIIKRIIETKRPSLIGPVTGVPGFFVGPIYYYLIILPYLLGGGNPMWPITFLIFLGVVGIVICGLMIKEKKRWLGFLICLFLLTFNYSHIQFSRWLSNPNPIFILAPLYYYALFLYLTSKKRVRVLKLDLIYITGFLLGLVLQTEFANAVFFIPTTVLILLVGKKLNLKDLIKFSFGFLIAVSPLIVFNLRHDFIMVKAIKSHLAKPHESVPLINILRARPSDYLRILTFFVVPKNKWLFVILSFSLLVYLWKKRFWQDVKLVILFFWFITPLIMFLFYQSNKGVIWDYYLISQPFPFLMLLSLFLRDFIKKFRPIVVPLIVLFLVFFAIVNIKEWLILQSPGANSLSYGKKLKAIDKIYQIANSEPFELEIFVPNLQPHGYYYLFEWYGAKKYDFTPKFEGGNQKLLFFIIETSDSDINQYWQKWWYNQREDVGKIIKTTKIGDIKIEVRQKQDL